MSSPCPCGSDITANTCCARFLEGGEIPDSPEALMRSRFSAWRAGNYAYLLQTLHPDARDGASESSLRNSGHGVVWHSLRVLDAPAAGTNQGIVEFVAFFTPPTAQQQTQGREQPVEQLHERSVFIRQDGIWYYHSGAFLPPLKPARNEPCWCGSGQKLKKCHAKT